MCAYPQSVYPQVGPESVGKVTKAKLFYDYGDFPDQATAIATISARCPATPTDMMVFSGELYDLVPDVFWFRGRLQDESGRTMDAVRAPDNHQGEPSAE